MQKIVRMGFPRMHKEKSERRDFLPGFFKSLEETNIEVLLENGYGSKMGYLQKDYLEVNRNIRFDSLDKVLKCDIVIVLRCPDNEELLQMERGSTLISMLHYDTRETRNELLKSRGINCFSMDEMTNDQNERLLVNYRGTSRTGSRISFEELKERTNDFSSIDKPILEVSIVGAGAVASNAAKAFEEFGDKEFLESDRGLLIHMLTRSITEKKELMKEILSKSDILVDASKRRDSSKYIISNDILECLPAHSIILDLAADPYNIDIDPIQVKGIEGIPTGTLDKYIIESSDSLYREIPGSVNSQNRRVVVSCNAWPGIDAEDCMRLYGEQLIPFLDVILTKGPLGIELNSRNMYERSLVRSSLDYFLKKEIEVN